MNRDDLKDLEEIARMGGNGPLKDYLESRLAAEQGHEKLPHIERSDEHNGNDNVSAKSAHEEPMQPAWIVVLKWCAGICATVVAGVTTTGVVWIISVSVSTASKVDVLLSRPEPVPLSQYTSDMAELKSRVALVEQQLKIKATQREQSPHE